MCIYSVSAECLKLCERYTEESNRNDIGRVTEAKMEEYEEVIITTTAEESEV